MTIVTRTNNDRIMVFVDVRNVIRGARRECPGPFTVDFAGMVKQIAGNRNIRGAYCFDGLSDPENEKDCESFHRNLQRDGFRVVLRNAFDVSERMQKEVDMSMGCTMVALAYQDAYDTAIVVSGDRDFLPAIEMIESLGKTVEIASFLSSKSSELARGADVFHNLSKMPIIQMSQPVEDVVEDVDTTTATAETMWMTEVF